MITRVREKPTFLEGVDNLRDRREAKGKIPENQIVLQIQGKCYAAVSDHFSGSGLTRINL